MISYLTNHFLLCTATSIFVVLSLILYYCRIRNYSKYIKNNKNINFNKFDSPSIIENKSYSEFYNLKNKDTLLSKNTTFTGNINIKGNIYISGKIYGNITAKENTVYIMQTGKIIGNIIAKKIIIDGIVKGKCIASNINILECGKLFGIMKCYTIMIKEGGKFIGKSKKFHINKTDDYCSNNSILILNPNKNSA
ncbi:MAG: polymer-forming cytoskeletal protein [Wigglesworthia glossinidia]|nr:polymer-forming cytoskeletal protein [Wigglesworthia glossinidia]